MYTARITTSTLKKAWRMANELTVPVSMSGDCNSPEVQVLGIRALEVIPGETKNRTLGHGSGAVVEASRTYDGVKFYCMMSPAQHEAINERDEVNVKAEDLQKTEEAQT